MIVIQWRCHSYKEWYEMDGGRTIVLLLNGWNITSLSYRSSFIFIHWEHMSEHMEGIMMEIGSCIMHFLYTQCLSLPNLRFCTPILSDSTSKLNFFELPTHRTLLLIWIKLHSLLEFMLHLELQVVQRIKNGHLYSVGNTTQHSCTFEHYNFYSKGGQISIHSSRELQMVSKSEIRVFYLHLAKFGITKFG